MKEKNTDKPTAEAFLSYAQQYCAAANALVANCKDVEAPVYFLFAHTLELALKAFLRTRNINTPYGQAGHNLPNLGKLCEANGLIFDSQFKANILRGLDEENKEHGFRYFFFASTLRPSIEYVQEEVNRLMKFVEDEVEKCPSEDEGANVVKFTFSKLRIDVD